MHVENKSHKPTQEAIRWYKASKQLRMHQLAGGDSMREEERRWLGSNQLQHIQEYLEASNSEEP